MALSDESYQKVLPQAETFESEGGLYKHIRGYARVASSLGNGGTKLQPIFKWYSTVGEIPRPVANITQLMSLRVLASWAIL